MSTSPTTHPQAVVPVPGPDREIRIYSHSALFYWWPVWACGLIMSLVTWIDGGRMLVVPSSAAVAENVSVINPSDGKPTIYPVVVEVPATSSGKAPSVDTEKRWMSRDKNLGVLFVATLLVTILITSVSMRGLWSVLLVLFVVLLIVILALAGVWSNVANAFSLIDIRINFAGYLVTSLILFAMWALAVFVFDRRTYLAITSGQVRLCTAIGAGETVYDTTGMTFQKRQDDLFRHWIVGLGSGDLVLHRTNVNQEIDFPNVLFIGGKVREIEKLFKEREVV